MNDPDLGSGYGTFTSIVSLIPGTCAVDDGDAGTSSTGEWTESALPGCYGADSLVNGMTGSTYTFEGCDCPGKCEVDLWWVAAANRCAALPVKVYDGATLLATVTVDQTANGSKWNKIGKYAFTSTPKIVLTSTGRGYASADAANFVCLGDVPDLSGLGIEGPSSIPEGTSQDYDCRAVYSNGMWNHVQPTWTVSGANATISATGLVTAPAVNGEESCRITASYTEDGITRTATFDLTIASDRRTVIVDDGGAGTSSTGDWEISIDPCSYGPDSMVSHDYGATYTFEADIAGTWEVDLRWIASFYCDEEAPVEIYDGATLLDTMHIDQCQGGCRWNGIGTYTFTSTAKVVISIGDGTTCADAVRFVEVGPPAVVSLAIEGPATVDEIDDGQYTCRATYRDGTVKAVTPKWVTCSFATISATGLLAAGPVSRDEACQVTASYNEAGITRTASLAITIRNTGDGRPTAIIDDGGAGTSSTGTWSPSSAAGYHGTGALYSTQAGATYAFEATGSGTYEVDLWWTENANRCSAVQVRVYDGTTLLATRTVDQRANGGKWIKLGTDDFTFASGRMEVVILSGGGCVTVADAVRFLGVRALAAIAIEGPATVEEDTSQDYNCRATYTDGSSKLVEPAWGVSCPYATISPTGLLAAQAVTGDQHGQITASCTEGGVTKTATFDFTIRDVSPPVPTVIVDDGDAGTSSTGTWMPSTLPGFYGTNSLVSNGAGATYTFPAALTGTWEVDLWWVAHSNRGPAVPVKVYDGTALLLSATVNQTANGSKWNKLGTWAFTGTGKVVLGINGSAFTSADAVRFLGQGSPGLVSIAIEGPAAVDEGATAQYTCKATYDDGAVKTVSPGTWGTCSSAAISATGLLAAGPVSSDQACQVTASYTEGGITRTASLAITIRNTGDGPPTVILDDGGAGTSSTGTWSPSGVAGYHGTGALYSTQAGATYTFEATGSGTYEVDLWWTENANRCSAVQVRVYDGTTLLATRTVDQRTDGGKWNELGTSDFTFASGRMEVVIVSGGGCVAVADAVRFMGIGWAPALASIAIEGPATIQEWTYQDYNCRATYSDGTSKLVEPAWGMRCPYAWISDTGLLHADEVNGDQHGQIVAAYAEGGVTKTATFDFTIQDVSVPATVIVDDGTAGTSSAGTWTVSGLAGCYGMDSLVSDGAGATYTFQAALTGTWEVDLWWVAHANRGPAVPVKVYDGTALLLSTTVNQTANGSMWNKLGTWAFTGTAKVILYTGGGAYTSADAARFAR